MAVTWEADLVDRIEEVRRRNNHCWMELLRLALEAEPEKAKAVLQKISHNDSEIQRLLGELASD